MLTKYPDASKNIDNRKAQVTMGHDEHGIVLVVSHTFQSIDKDHCVIRIISARKATKRERTQYGA